MHYSIIMALLLNLIMIDRALSFVSVYTNTRKNCAVLSRGLTGRVWRCQGPAGISAVFSDEGNVADVEFGRKGSEKNLGGLQWQAGAEALGPRIEWRMKAGRPVSAILRILTIDENGALQHRLLIAKVTLDGGCLIESIDARFRRANIKAREIADNRSATHRCGQ